MAKGLLFENNDKLLPIGEADANQIGNVLIMHKGWNKFSAHVGFGIEAHLKSPVTLVNKNRHEKEITINLLADNAQVNSVDITGGIINTQIDANYNS